MLLRAKKAKDMGDTYEKELNELLGWYFNDYEANKDFYDKVNLEWKKLCQQVNGRQSIIKLRVDAFEKEVERIISENPAFQTVTDLTKI
jgi:hypothetical protein